MNADRRGELVRSGVRAAIVGPPNVGKSSILNFLAGRKAAIVSAIPGTTRDAIEVILEIAGYKVAHLSCLFTSRLDERKFEVMYVLCSFASCTTTTVNLELTAATAVLQFFLLGLTEVATDNVPIDSPFSSWLACTRSCLLTDIVSCCMA